MAHTPDNPPPPAKLPRPLGRDAPRSERGDVSAFIALGTCTAHLDEAQREALLRAARSAPAAVKGRTIAVLVAGAVHFGEDG